jgi:hypothetical protein
MQSLSRVVPEFRRIGAWFVLPLLLGSCELYELPETGPSARAVLDAAREVIAARYPMSAASEPNAEQGFVTAITPPAMEGGAKTQRRISVIVRRNYTGAYEPMVRVRQYVDMATPLEGSPTRTDSPALASPLDQNRWRVMGYLELEEQALTEAILRKLGTAGV